MAEIVVLVTDMGNGCRLCSECSHNLDGGNPCIPSPPSCPKCGVTFTRELAPFINRGGSDF